MSPRGARRGAALPALAAAGLATVTCIPSVGPSDSGITSTRILAVRADPAEAAPGAQVTFTALVASPSGEITGAPVAWSFCTAPRPITDDNIVSNACLGTSSLVAAGAGPAVSASTPSSGCALFGPDTPPGNFRPADPDGTGGYYQPLRADLAGAATAFVLVRIHCDLADAALDVAKAYAAAYTLNQNPTLSPLTAAVGGAPVSLTALPAGARVTFTTGWPAASAETFAYVDPVSQTLTTQREAMEVSWYSTAGAFDLESTNRATTDMTTTSADTWTAPGGAGPVRFFVVLRDSRGGVAFAEQDGQVQ